MGDRVCALADDGYPVEGRVKAVDTDGNVFVSWEPGGDRTRVSPHDVHPADGRGYPDEVLREEPAEEKFGGLASRHRLAREARLKRAHHASSASGMSYPWR